VHVLIVELHSLKKQTLELHSAIKNTFARLHSPIKELNSQEASPGIRSDLKERLILPTAVLGTKEELWLW
jgi:hypothetical protein